MRCLGLLVNTELPMKRINKSGNDFLKPILSFRYSPNNTKNISNKDLRLSYDNIFSLNRIGTNEIVEGGKSLSLGIEYKNKITIIIFLNSKLQIL